MPAHTHGVHASSSDPTESNPTNAYWAKYNHYSDQDPNGTMNPTTVSTVGGNGEHDNMMPYLPINYIISLNGMYPVEN